jgi:hypothetical protein
MAEKNRFYMYQTISERNGQYQKKHVSGPDQPPRTRRSRQINSAAKRSHFHTLEWGVGCVWYQPSGL